MRHRMTHVTTLFLCCSIFTFGKLHLLVVASTGPGQASFAPSPLITSKRGLSGDNYHKRFSRSKLNRLQHPSAGPVLIFLIEPLLLARIARGRESSSSGSNPRSL